MIRGTGVWLLYLFCNKSHYENVPFEIPENWCWVTGNDIFNAMISCKPQGDEFKYIDIDSIDNKNHRITSPKILKVKNAPSRASRYTQPGDVLFSMVRPYLKNIALVEEGSCIASTGFFVCSPMQLLTSEYCYYMMLSDYVVYGLNQYMKGDNSPSINNGHITSWLYPIPPINEQLRITTEIKKWFVFIDDLESGEIELESLIKQVKSKILDLAISGKLVPQDPNDEPAIELLKRINPDFQPCDNSHYENLPFEIPSTWVWVSHNDMLEISGGAQPPKSEFSEVMKPGYIRLYQIRDYGEKPIPIYIPLSTASKTTVKGDILLARYGGSLGKVFIAEDGAYNVAMAKVILCYPEVLNQKFVYYYYLSSIYQNKLRSISRTAQAGFNSGDFEDMYFPLPPLEEQGRIVNAISSIWEMIDMITAEL